MNFYKNVTFQTISERNVQFSGKIEITRNYQSGQKLDRKILENCSTTAISQFLEKTQRPEKFTHLETTTSFELFSNSSEKKSLINVLLEVWQAAVFLEQNSKTGWNSKKKG